MTAGRRANGQALVEFALVLPIIVLLLFGTLDLGRAVYVYNTLSEASRQAARLAIVNQNVGQVQQAAVQYAPTTGLTAADVSVCFKAPASSDRDCSSPSSDACVPLRSGCLAIVTSRLDYSLLTPVIDRIVGPVTLSSTSILPIEYVCTKATCP